MLLSILRGVWTLLAVLLTLPCAAVYIAYSVARSALRKPQRLPKNAALPAHILLSSATELALRLRSGEISAVSLTRDHIARLRKVDAVLHCVASFRGEHLALREAEAADALLAQCRNTRRLDQLPPFLGVPCTVKEVFAMEGMQLTSSVSQRLGVISTADSPIVAAMRRAGFVIIGTTTTSQLCMWYESYQLRTALRWGINQVSTGNPYDDRCIVGGSSGGEAATIAAGASPCGGGSDIGGSIRMPAAFNGIYGHKPTGGLVSNAGQVPSTNCVAMTTGPLCRFAEDLWPLLMLMAAANRQPGDPHDGSLRAVTLVDVALPLLHTGSGAVRGAGSGGGESAAAVFSTAEVGAAAASTAVRPQQQQQRSRSRSRSPSSRPPSPTRRRAASQQQQQSLSSKTSITAAPPYALSRAPRVLSSWSDVTVHVLTYDARPAFTTPVQGRIRAAIAHSAQVLVSEYGCRGVVELELPELRDAFELWSSVLALEDQPSFKTLLEEAFDRPIDIGTELLLWCVGASTGTLPALVLAMIERLPLLVSPARVAEMRDRAWAFKRRFNAQMAVCNGVLLCPVHPTVASYHDVPLLRPFNVAWTQIFNITESPATAVPLGLDPASGLPLAMQVVGGTGFDGLTIAIANALEARGEAGWRVPPFSGGSV